MNDHLPGSRWLARGSLGVGFLAIALLIAEGLRVALGSNFHTVKDGHCYRAAQPSAEQLASLARSHGIRTVFNLRGVNPQHAWYEAERKATREAGVRLADFSLTSNVPPPTSLFRDLVYALDHAERPLLIHCHSGADRTGLVSALFVLLQPEGTLDQARGQLSVRFGHKFWSEAAHLSLILDSYEDWLAASEAGHSPDRFRQWANEVYRDDELWSRIHARSVESIP